eukprot:TRINITY_DN6611_c0_g1_i6.p1 TRINITY_DN6611_c0_g1~~TRINITY_DN6611_c0_g1_i6.p1  ORF type:complete len:706 (+),score=153.76 TRINITY_DN6611_c0_g1_i6:87-2120(+)
MASVSEPDAKASSPAAPALKPTHAVGAFPIDLSAYQEVSIDPWAVQELSGTQRETLKANIQLCRDAIVFFTACGGASGYGGHTGGAYDMMPEVCILDTFFCACPDKFVTTFFDEAGHRVATQYLFSVLRKHMPAERLLKYRVGKEGLPGHPELGRTPGIEFSSGRLGHLWGHVNGVCRASPGKTVCCFGSDGSQMEGNNAEAARFAVANGFNVKLFIDDNDVTIAGHPSSYLKGYNVGQSLSGHGLKTADVDGEDIDALFAVMRAAIVHDGPFAAVIKRKMCPNVEKVEGTPEGHDAMALASAIQYLESKGYPAAVEMLKKVPKAADPYGTYLGGGKFGAPRQAFGDAVANILGQLSSPEERRAKVLVVDSDLEGSCGLKKIRESCPEVYIKSGVMERGNFSACAGFGFASESRQGVFGTFAAFQEMILSEVTMARLNFCNVLCHFSHSGVDDMSDNMCHFGQNNFFADNGLAEEGSPKTQLFFPADVNQMAKVVKTIFWMKGLRFIYSTRSKVPEVLDEAGKPFFGANYTFSPGHDDVIIGGADSPCVGYVVSYGDALYRSLDAVRRLRDNGIKIGLINKCHVNAVDEAVLKMIGQSEFVLVVESQNTQTGLGMRMGTWLLERGLAPKLGRCGTHCDGCGGTWEQAYGQGYDPNAIIQKLNDLGFVKKRKADQMES